MRELLDAADVEHNTALGTPVRTQRRKLPRLLLAAFVSLLLIEAASFRWVFGYQWSRGSWGCEQGSTFVFYAVQIPPQHTGLRAHRLVDYSWRTQLPVWSNPYDSYPYVSIPLWPLILATGAAALWTHRRSRQFPNLCPHCHYNLRGLPPSNGQVSCPECGNSSIAQPPNAPT